MWQPVGSLGAYRIDAQLRTGGMGTVFLGHRVGVAGFRRPVALKVIHPHLAQDPNFVRMFIDEALLASRIDHPNVVKVEELSCEDGVHFLAMEYVHGPSVGQIIRSLAQAKRVLKVELAVSIAAETAAGLHAAHETRAEDGELLGVVHRDVKPQNLLVSQNGHVKLIDFGIAKARGTHNRSHTGSIKGTLRYLAPEQARAGAVDRRADVYSLGITLWEMLSGRRLFQTDSDLELLDLVRNPNAPRLRSERPDIPQALDDVVAQMLSPSADGRPESALAARRALLEAVPGAAAVTPEARAELVESLFGKYLASAALENGRAKNPTVTKGTKAVSVEAALERMTIVGTNVDALVGDPEPPAPTLVQRSESARARPLLWALAATTLVLAAALGYAAVWITSRGEPEARSTPVVAPAEIARAPVMSEPEAAHEPPAVAPVEAPAAEVQVERTVIKTRRAPRPPRRRGSDLPLVSEPAF
jgi:eukaryotic-like serine/threonine-protein kinase